MNKIKYLWMAILGLTAAVSSCSHDEALPDAEDNANIVEDLNILHPSRLNAEGTAEGFAENAKVGLFMTESLSPLQVSGNYMNNELLTKKGNQWASSRTLNWGQGNYTIYAYYPYCKDIPSVDNMPFSVSLNQNSPASASQLGGYEASDFLWATKKNVAASNEKVNLQFSHRMSKIMVELVKGPDYSGEIPADAEVYIHNTVTDAVIDMSAGVVARNKYATAKTLRAKNLGNNKHAAIIVPQRIDNRQPLVEVIMKGVSYLYETRFIFKPGMQHNVKLTISDNPEKVKIEIGGEAENWGE